MTRLSAEHRCSGRSDKGRRKMRNTFGSNVAVTLFGESHGEAIGCVLDGLAPGIKIDEKYIAEKLALRRPAGVISTARREKDEYKIVSGVFGGFTTGAPLCIVIPNADIKSSDYDELKNLARPGHADLTAQIKYNGFQDYRGGGHFSGRLTAPIVAAGAICLSALEAKGIKIATHISAVAGIRDRRFDPVRPETEDLDRLYFPLLDREKEQEMRSAIESAANEGDSVGGELETAVTGLPAGLGEPWFDSAESLLSHALFSIPAVKGIEFGAGFGFETMKGSEVNDPISVKEGKISTLTNNNGGINGGITNSMPLIFRLAVKPTPSIAKAQQTVDMRVPENASLELKGRHDPCIVHRARAVADAVTAIVICDLLAARYGTDYLAKED